MDPFADTTPGRRYEGKVVVVTGAAGGIGRATALRMAAEGATVWCADLAAAGVAATAEEIRSNGGAAREATVDVTDPAAAAALVARVVEQDGGIDVLANIAGIGGMAHTTDETPENFARLLAVNSAGPFHMIQPALPTLLERGGNVVNLASTAGVIGQAYCASYCASKHALVGMTKALALEFGRKGIRFNAVCPGGVNTGLLGSFLPPEGHSPSLIGRAFLDANLQEPESVAALVCYVGSPEAHYVNGAVMVVDGGTTAG